MKTNKRPEFDADTAANGEDRQPKKTAEIKATEETPEASVRSKVGEAQWRESAETAHCLYE